MTMMLRGGDVPNVFLAESAGSRLGDAFAGIEGVDIVGVGRTGREVSAAIRGPAVDIFAFPVDWAELSRTIRISLGLAVGEGPAFVMATGRVSAALILKSHLYGFDGIVDTAAGAESRRDQVAGIVERTRLVSDDPLVRDLGLEHGQLAREPVIAEGEDRDIADLVGGGLTDDEIADLLRIPIQRVRNRVEHLITHNGLVYRTQLAILVASLVRVPDFS